MAIGILKTCSRCGENKDQTEFGKGHLRCKHCLLAVRREQYAQDAELREKIKRNNRKWGAANKELKAAMDRAYRATNAEKCRDKSRAWVAANKERTLKAQNKHRWKNIEAYRAREAAYREKNREACNARINEWKQRNPHACVVYFHKRRAAQLQALPSWADLDAIAAVYQRAQTMGAGYHVDHIVPLISPLVCGLHCEANLQVITAEENMKKNNKHWPDMWGEVIDVSRM